MGISSSFLIKIEKTAMILPNAKLPVSPMKTCAGKELYHKKPMQAAKKQDAKITNSEVFGMYKIFK